MSEKPTCKLTGADGNVFNLIGLAGRALRRAGMFEAEKEMTDKCLASKSYDEAIQIIMSYVEVE